MKFREKRLGKYFKPISYAWIIYFEPGENMGAAWWSNGTIEPKSWSINDILSMVSDGRYKRISRTTAKLINPNLP